MDKENLRPLTWDERIGLVEYLYGENKKDSFLKKLINKVKLWGAKSSLISLKKKDKNKGRF